MRSSLSALKLILFMFVLFLASACALAPVSSNFTGRSLGSGKVGLDGGAVLAGSGLIAGRLTVGVGPNLDFGAQYDTLSAGLFAKYSLINSGTGFSLAGFVGGGKTIGGQYIYAGPAVSLKFGGIEPYFVGRYNWVHYGETKSSGGFDIEEGDYSYLQFTGGAVFWFSRAFGIQAEASYFSGTTGSTQLIGPLISGGLKIRF